MEQAYYIKPLMKCRAQDECLLPNVSYTICLSSDTNIVIKSKSFTSADLINECHEDFIENILNKSCSNSSLQSTRRATLTSAESYGYGLLAVFIISVLSIGGLLAFPVLYSVSFKYVLNLFTALAVGTLFGDTMFHLIPFALDIHSHRQHDEHPHSIFSVPDYIWKMLVSVSVLYVFYLLEFFLHSCSHSQHEHAHILSDNHAIFHHEHIPVNVEVSESTPMNTDVELVHDHQLHTHMNHNSDQHDTNELDTKVITNQINDTNDNNNNNNHSVCFPCAHVHGHLPTSLFSHDLKKYSSKTSRHTPVSVVVTGLKDNNSLKNTNPFIQKLQKVDSTGWMVLIGDGIHNFADGLAMGAAFSQDLLLGLTTTCAIALHELPHEFGDYAVLIQSGFSHSRAILWNFISALTAFIGFFIGVTLSSNDHIRQWIFAVTIGMFIYIALVDLLPALLSHNRTNIKRFVIVNIGIITGIAIMFVLALFEDSLIRTST
ncbi:unnamed protein product [Rotaria sp. Silwood1]|nr:unnamed protein product [Rotaria sp. Silwood1]CAF3460771.1 unnamed protein product [Rotaria sp. Silwood1]CAF3518298.1 unnamed protein product [Rotaria sp. Silwood1]CAF4622709.1 unnamed protein product [Rotaria sp. Silwood1]CAF4758121.1 unnamed protein product [Rotaria sp. Silwood1]